MLDNVEVSEKIEVTISCSEEEFRDHCESYDGVCLDCGEWSSGGCEPDAVDYECEACGNRAVSGAEEALMGGWIEIAE